MPLRKITFNRSGTHLAAAVNDNDAKFPPDFRLSKKNRKKKD